MNSPEEQQKYARAEVSPAAAMRGGAGTAFVTPRSPEQSQGVTAPAGAATEFSSNGLLSSRLLSALPAEDFTRLLPHLEPVTLHTGEDLHGFDEEMRHAYFPENAVVAQLHTLSDGGSVEAALIGREGLIGLSAVFGSRPSSRLTQVLIPGVALRMKMETCTREFGRAGALQRLLLDYARDRITQVSQRAVCNGRHKVGERFCTWLLMIHDRAGDDRLPLTHEQAARHLGVRRAGITQAANVLRDKDAIDYGRARVRVRDRRALEAAACECYQIHKLNQ